MNESNQSWAQSKRLCKIRIHKETIDYFIEITLQTTTEFDLATVLYHISKDVMYWARTYINDIVFNSEHIVDGLEWGDGGVAGLVHLRCLVDNSNLPELKGTFD